MEGHKMSDRELLIRIDERQQQMSKDMAAFKTELANKVSRGSITWVITIAGGALGLISTAMAIADKAH